MKFALKKAAASVAVVGLALGGAPHALAQEPVTAVGILSQPDIAQPQVAPFCGLGISLGMPPAPTSLDFKMSDGSVQNLAVNVEAHVWDNFPTHLAGSEAYGEDVAASPRVTITEPGHASEGDVFRLDLRLYRAIAYDQEELKKVVPVGTPVDTIKALLAEKPEATIYYGKQHAESECYEQDAIGPKVQKIIWDETAIDEEVLAKGGTFTVPGRVITTYGGGTHSVEYPLPGEAYYGFAAEYEFVVEEPTPGSAGLGSVILPGLILGSAALGSSGSSDASAQAPAPAEDPAVDPAVDPEADPAVKPQPAPRTGKLANTGAENNQVLAVAALLTIAGAGVFAYATRRRA